MVSKPGLPSNFHCGSAAKATTVFLTALKSAANNSFLFIRIRGLRQCGTVKIIWMIYIFFTMLSGIMFFVEGMSGFDALCHALTTISTGGFSTHDASIAYFKSLGPNRYIAIEYTVILFMILGSMNFLIHYRLFSKDIKALWDNLEIRSYWKMIAEQYSSLNIKE
jgi:hypothetical protein